MQEKVKQNEEKNVISPNEDHPIPGMLFTEWKLLYIITDLYENTQLDNEWRTFCSQLLSA